MPITPAIVTPNHLVTSASLARLHGARATARARLSVLVASALVAWSATAMAGPKFTLVVSGRITTVDALPTPGGNLVSIRAVGELVKAIPGATLSADKETGVVSISRKGAEGGSADAGALNGFKAGPLTFVVDGKISKSTVKLSGGGVFVPAKDLKKLAETLGFAAELDGGASVLALTPKAAPADASFIGGVAEAAGAAAVGVNTGDGSVCGYMDGMKTLWLATEPSSDERDTLKRITTVFQSQSKNNKKGNPADLKLLESTLRGFDAKLQRRLAGTRGTTAPPDAEAWRSVSVEFLEKVDEVMRVSFDLVRVMKLPEAKQKAEGKKPVQNAERLQALNAEVQAIGSRQVMETVSVRESNGCSPP